MKDKPMRNLKLLLATTAFAIVAAIPAKADESTNGFSCARNLSWTG